MKKVYEFDAILHEIPKKGGAYVIFPWDIREEFGKGRIRVHTTFDGIEYDGSIVNMGLKDDQGKIIYILVVLKRIQNVLNKKEGDMLHVKVWPAV